MVAALADLRRSRTVGVVPPQALASVQGQQSDSFVAVVRAAVAAVSAAAEPAVLPEKGVEHTQHNQQGCMVAAEVAEPVAAGCHKRTGHLVVVVDHIHHIGRIRTVFVVPGLQCYSRQLEPPSWPG